MKLGFTINIGNFENIKVESSEHDNIISCKNDLLQLLKINYSAFEYSDKFLGSQKSKDALLCIKRFIDIIEKI